MNKEIDAIGQCGSSSDEEKFEGFSDSSTASSSFEFNNLNDADPTETFGFEHEKVEDDSVHTDIDYLSSSENEEFCQQNEQLRDRLGKWVTKYNLSRPCVNEILDILESCGHELPRDKRTLLRTPRTHDIIEKCNGKYAYFGIENCITGLLRSDWKPSSAKLLLTVNVDGIPVFHSTNDQFWPILVSVDNSIPEIVAIFYGRSKPSPVEDFLADFLEEYKRLYIDGITYEDMKFTLDIKCFICDAPARALLKSIVGHTSKNACERCTAVASWLGRAVYNSSTDSPLRTDDGFAKLLYEQHQVKTSPLIEYKFKCVSQFSLDYMHLVCLGVVRRMLIFLIQGPRQCKLSRNQITEISNQLVLFNGKLPSEFARQPRSLDHIQRFKATEFRQFLLYTGPIVLRRVLPRNVYCHFLLLTVAMSILLNEDDLVRLRYLQYAQQLLQKFVNEAKLYYSDIFTVYNVHSLKHLCDDVKNFRCSLNRVSAFPFENHLQSIKKLVRNAKNPLAQIINRLSEKRNYANYSSRESHYRIVSSRERDCCFLTKSGQYIFIEKETPQGLVCRVVGEHQTQNFFVVPCESKLIDIVFIGKQKTYKKRVIQKTSLARKCVSLSYRDGLVCLPLLHGD